MVVGVVQNLFHQARLHGDGGVGLGAVDKLDGPVAFERPQGDHVKAEQEGAGRDGRVLVHELGQGAGGGDDGAHAALLDGAAQARQPGRIRGGDLHEHFGFVNQEEERAAVRADGAVDTT